MTWSVEEHHNVTDIKKCNLWYLWDGLVVGPFHVASKVVGSILNASSAPLKLCGHPIDRRNLLGSFSLHRDDEVGFAPSTWGGVVGH